MRRSRTAAAGRTQSGPLAVIRGGGRSGRRRGRRLPDRATGRPALAAAAARPPTSPREWVWGGRRARHWGRPRRAQWAARPRGAPPTRRPIRPARDSEELSGARFWCSKAAVGRGGEGCRVPQLAWEQYGGLSDCGSPIVLQNTPSRGNETLFSPQSLVIACCTAHRLESCTRLDGSSCQESHYSMSVRERVAEQRFTKRWR